MTARRLIYDSAIITIAGIILSPCAFALSGNLLGCVCALVYTMLLCYVLRSTKNGKWLLREWWRSVLRLERFVLGDNS